MDNREQLREAARAELMRRGIELPEASDPGTESLRRAARAELERRGIVIDSDSKGLGRPEEKEHAQEFSWPTAIVEAGGRGLLSLPDFLQHIAVSGSEAGRNSLLSASQSLRRSVGRNAPSDLSEAIQEPITGPNWQPSDIVPRTQIPTTPGQRIGMNAAETAGAFALPFGGATRIAKNIATGLGVGAGSGALKEMGAPPLAADIAALVGGIAGPGMIKKAFRPRGLSSEEAKVSETLRGLVGENEFPAVSENLRAPGPNIMGYEPMTAELANNPTMSKIHRTRMGIPGTGISEQSGRQNEAIMSHLGKQATNPSSSNEIRQNITSELEKRIGIREEATKEGYKSVEKMKGRILPSHLIKFLKEKPAAGLIEKDLNSIRRELKPTKKPTKSDLEYKNFYEKSSPSAQSKMEKPKSFEPKISKLAAVDADLTAKIEGFSNSGKYSRAKVMKQAQKELRKDLDVVETYKEARAKYKELSKPVNEISPKKKEVPNLEVLSKSQRNNIMNELYNTKSEKNVAQLRKALGNNPQEWEGIQHATTEHFVRRVLNAQAEGKTNVISYDKLRKFMQSHEKALEHVYTKEQMQVIKEIEKAIHGQNTAKTLGSGVGSDTQVKQAIDKLLDKGLDIRGLEWVTKRAPIGRSLRSSASAALEWVASKNEKQLADILDRSLREPEYAHKLLTHEFKSPSDVKRFFHTSLPISSVISVDIGYKKKRKEDERRK
jgi:hypothetical protein